MVAHGIGADEALFRFIALPQLVEDRVSKLRAVEAIEIDLLGNQIDTELREYLGLEGGDVPFVGMRVFRRVLIEQLRDNAGDVVVEDEFLLIDALQQLAAQAIDRLALLVHYIVIFEQVFARFKVLRFDSLLRGFDPARDQPRLDWNAFFHAKPLEQVRDPLLGEDAHQVIFEGKIEA